jgi:hypothetical protein
MKAEPRPYSHILSDPSCPEDPAVGCNRCDGGDNCIIQAHDDEKCWELPNFGLTCEICIKQDKDIRMMEGEE